MSNDKMRKEFEAWASGPPYTLPTRIAPSGPFCGDYEDTYVELAWNAWQAGRKAGMEEAAALCDAVNRDRERAMAVVIREAAK